MAGLNFAFTADNANFMRALNEVTAGVRDASRQIEAEGGNIDRVISTIKGGVATLGIGLGFREITNQIKDTRGEFQMLEISFNTMLGSTEKSQALMSQLIRTAAITPFDLKGVADGAKSLLAYGVQAEEVNDTLVRLGDICAGLNIPLNDLVYLYGTTMVQGRMFTQDLRQFQGRGVPLADELAKQFGVAKDKVGELVTAGKVGAKEFKAAIQSMTAEGSQFGGLMEAQSKSLPGQIANIEDAIDVMFNEIGKNTEGVMNATLSATGTIVENWQTVLAILGDIAAAYGVQKAILALDAGFTKAATNYGYDAEIAQLQALIPLKEEEQKTALQQAVASGNLTEAKAAQIATLREEAKAQLDVLVAKETAAKAEEASALARATAAKSELDDNEEFVRSCAEKLAAITEVGDAEEIETALTELETAEALRNEAANIANTLSEEARAAATNATAASEARETLATQINTAETAGNAAATNILTIAKQKLGIVIARVNALMAANKFAIVTGLIIAMGYAIYKLATYQSDYQKSLEKVSKATDEARIAGDKEIKTLDELNAKLSVTQKGSEEWKSVKDAIVKQFGQYIPQLDEEITKVGNLSTAYHDLTKAIQEASAAKGLKKFLDENDNADEVETKFRETLSEWKKSTGKLGEKGMSILEPILREYSLKSSSDKDIFSFVEDQLKISYGTDTGGKLYDAYEYFLKNSKLKGFNEAHQMNRSREMEIEMYLRDMSISDAQYNKVRYGIEPIVETPKTQDKSYWEQKKKDAVSRLEALTDIAAKGKEGDKIREEIAEYNKRLESFDDGSKKKSGITAEQTASKIEEEHQQLLDLIKRQAEERMRLRQECEYQEWQNRIDSMQEGETKVIAQMQLDHHKELSSLEEQKKQAVNAEIERQRALWNAREDEKSAGNKKHAKRIFNPETSVNQAEIKAITERYDNLHTQLLSKQKKAEQDRLNASKEAYDNYLKEFGNYQQKREAIEAEYDKRISESIDEGERLMNEGQKRRDLSDLDYEEWISKGDIALAFGDISNLSKDTIDSLIADMERYRERVINTFDPDKIQRYEDALASLRIVSADNSFGAFSEMVPDYFKQRKSVSMQLDSAGTNINAIFEKRAEIYNRIISLQEQINAGESNGEDVSGLKDELRAAQVELDSNAKAAKDAQNAFKLLQEQWDNMNSPEEKFNAVCEVVEYAADLVGGLANQASQMADAMGAEGLGETLGYLGDAMGSVQNVASGFAKGGLVGGIAAAAGEVMNWATKLFMAGDAKHQKNIERLQEQIDTLGKSYEKVGKEADKAFSTDASNLINQQNILLKQQQTLIRQQVAEEEAKKKTDDDKIEEYRERLEDINETLLGNEEKAKEAIVGKDIKSAIGEFASLYAGAWDDGTDAAQKSMQAVKSIISSALNELLKKDIQPATQKFYDALAKAMEDGVLTDSELANLDIIKTEIDRIAALSEEQYKKIQNRYKDLDELKEELTDISFDSVRDNFKSLLTDMESTTDDFISGFTDMIRNSLIEGFMDNKYDVMLKEWYDEFAEAMKDQSLTDSERDSLRQKYDDIVQQGIADRNFINDIVGGNPYTQEASSGSAWNMNQETGEELSGRFTALVELEAINNTLVTDGNNIAREILMTLQSFRGLTVTSDDSDNPTLLAIKDMMFLSTGYLEDIAKYAKLIANLDNGIEQLRTLIDKRL